MKKVCILTSVHPVFDVRIFHKEAKSLVKAGYDVALIAQHNKNELVDGVKIIALPQPKNRASRILFLAKKAYRIAFQERADIYHFHDPELLPWMYILKKKSKAKIIYDVHEDVPKIILSKYWIPKYFRKFIALVMDIFEKIISKKFDVIITVTPEINKQFSRKKAVLIRNFPILFLAESIPSLKIDKKRLIAIYAGVITKIRGTKEIIKAIHLLDGKVELWLLGPFSPPSFKKEIAPDLKTDYIKYIGYVPFEKMFSFVKSADIGLVLFLPEPNHITAIPNKIFEYMAASLPIVASDFSLWKEIIEREKCGICVNPLEPKEVVKAIQYLIKHPEEAREMGQNGRKAVLEKYNWENESKKLLKVYEELCNK